MTIKQQGGIFGRNPTFNEVETTTISATNDGATVGTFQRNTSDGEILSLKKNSTQVLSIGTNASAADFYFANSTVGFGLMNAAADRVIPTDGTGAATTNQLDLGRNGQSWKNLYVGTGIYFQDSGAVANHLDDYEEGSWTPDVQDTSGNSASTSSAIGLYTKVGDVVTAFIRVIDVNTGGLTSGDAIRVYGLPYTALGVVRYSGSAIINTWTGTTGLITQVIGGNTHAQFKTASNGNALVSEITSGSADIYAQVTYKV